MAKKHSPAVPKSKKRVRMHREPKAPVREPRAPKPAIDEPEREPPKETDASTGN
jgi:hypothetical protein